MTSRVRSIVSHKAVSVPAAYEAFLSALEQTGYTTVTVGNVTKVVSSGSAERRPSEFTRTGTSPPTTLSHKSSSLRTYRSVTSRAW